MSRRAFLLWLPLSDAIVAGLKRSVASTTINSTDLPCCTNALRWINKVLRESMNKRFFLRTVYPLFFPAGGGQKRCPTMWPKWMWPKSSAFIFGITPKWEDGRHTRFIFTPLLWQLRRTYNCPGNTQTEDGQGLGVSHQDSKGWWRKYSPSDMFSICFMTYNDLWWHLWILRILAIAESLWVWASGGCP